LVGGVFCLVDSIVLHDGLEQRTRGRREEGSTSGGVEVMDTGNRPRKLAFIRRCVLEEPYPFDSLTVVMSE